MEIEALDLNIDILISKYAPECEKYRKIGPKKHILFRTCNPPIFSFFETKEKLPYFSCMTFSDMLEGPIHVTDGTKVTLPERPVLLLMEKI